MRVLNSVLRFQTDPFNIVGLGHGVFYRTHRYMDSISLNFVYGDMFLPGCFCCAGNQRLHLFSTAVDGNALIPDHSNDIAAVLTNQKFLLHIPTLLQKVCPDQNK